jgi:hypothetical protein
MTLFHNKRGIELSINFIVMLILAIATFAGGLVFLSKFFGKAEAMRGTLDAQTERQIEKLLDSGSPVVLPISSKEIFRSKFDTFAVGVMAKYEGKYTIKINGCSGYTKNNEEIRCLMGGTGFQIQPGLTQELNLKKNQKGKALIGITVPKDAAKGTYIFNIEVTFTGTKAGTEVTNDPYDNPLQMIVKVP